jgi:histidyl-tRNA synthetase
MRRMTARYQAVRGTRDILPDEVATWRRLEDTTHAVLSRYGFREIRTPVFEATELFTRSVGTSTDIVRKEMYTWASGDESLTLRPENTAPVVRSFVEHSLHRTIAAGFPERLYYLGPMFRYERPQKGRQRQFHQIGAEVLGAEEPLADAETIEMVDALLAALGIADRELRLNTVGDAVCRPRFREALTLWLTPRLPSMCEDCRRRAVENPLRVFDCKVAADRKILEDAPRMEGSLCDPCAAHFAAVRAALHGYGIPYIVDSRLVRGLDYYQRTVFEVVAKGLGAQNALLGGGRYDGLVEELGGPSIPGFGFAAGMERLVLVMGASTRPLVETDVLLVGLGDAGFAASIGLARSLRARGLRVAMPLTERPMGAQLKRAERLGARFALFVGAAELTRGRFGLKNLASGEQIEVDEAGIEAAVRPSSHERNDHGR